jgi:hypothetical protein
VGPSAMENAAARRAFNLLAEVSLENVRKKGALQSAMPLGKGSVLLPSIANCLVCSPFRTVLFKEIGEIAYEGHDCHYRRSGEPDEEQCFQKQYQKMQHDLGYSTTPKLRAEAIKNL